MRPGAYLLLGFLLAAGCSANERAGEAHSASSVPPQTSADPSHSGFAAKGVNLDREHAEKRKDAKSQSPVYTYEKSFRAVARSGLKVTVKNESPPMLEAYRIRVYAVVPNGKSDDPTRKVILGGQDVFRPLREGENFEIFIDRITKEAFVSKGEGHVLRLGAELEVETNRPEKSRPKLRVVDVSEI